MGSGVIHKKNKAIELNVQKRLLKLAKGKVLTWRIWLYNLAKSHKDNVPLRPILSLVGPGQQRLAKYLANILPPVIEIYSFHFIIDSFTFATFKQYCPFDSNNKCMCSFDINNLFTCILIKETIKICADGVHGICHYISGIYFLKYDGQTNRQDCCG